VGLKERIENNEKGDGEMEEVHEGVEQDILEGQLADEGVVVHEGVVADDDEAGEAELDDEEAIADMLEPFLHVRKDVTATDKALAMVSSHPAAKCEVNAESVRGGGREKHEPTTKRSSSIRQDILASTFQPRAHLEARHQSKWPGKR
jgi:hypothetical protein